MPSNFPTSLDSYAGHNPGDVILDTHVDNVEDAIEAIEATVGITGSAVATSHDARLAALEAGSTGAAAADTYWVDHDPYNAAGDGATNDSTAIQDAIDDCAAAGGGVVMLGMGKTYKANVVLAQGVYLVSAAPMYGYQPGSLNMTRIIANATGVVIDTPGSSIYSCGVVGVNVGGLGAGTAAVGIRFRQVLWGKVQNVNFNSFADEGLLVDSTSGACIFKDLMAVNCVLDRTRAAAAGAIDVHGADHWMSNIEATVSSSIEGDISDANLYCCGVVIRASNCFLSGVMGEISDIGMLITGDLNRFTVCRADLNYGHGWRVTGGGNTFAGCQGISNGAAANNTYSEFQATSASGNNVFTGCSTFAVGTNKAKYGFEDQKSADTNKNLYVGCLSDGAVTAGMITDAGGSGAGLTFPAGPVRAFPSNTTTKDVTNWEHWYAADGSATTITDFTGGVNGQHLYILATNANTTIQHNGSTITLPGAVDLTLVSGTTYHFYKSGVWRRVQ